MGWGRGGESDQTQVRAESITPHSKAAPDDLNKRNLMDPANVHKYIPLISLPFSSPSGRKAERGRKELERERRRAGGFLFCFVFLHVCGGNCHVAVVGNVKDLAAAPPSACCLELPVLLGPDGRSRSGCQTHVFPRSLQPVSLVQENLPGSSRRLLLFRGTAGAGRPPDVVARPDLSEGRKQRFGKAAAAGRSTPQTFVRLFVSR